MVRGFVRRASFSRSVFTTTREWAVVRNLDGPCIVLGVRSVSYVVLRLLSKLKYQYLLHCATHAPRPWFISVATITTSSDLIELPTAEQVKVSCIVLRTQGVSREASTPCAEDFISLYIAPSRGALLAVHVSWSRPPHMNEVLSAL